MSGCLLIECESAADALSAARKTADAGFPAEDVLSPHPIEGIAEHLEPRPQRAQIGWAMVIAGLLGAAAGYAMQWYSAVIDYPILSGGRPLHSWQVFLLVPYETAILSATVTGTLAWLWLCRLPRLFHPLFAADAVGRAVQDRYLLVFRLSADLQPRLAALLPLSRMHELPE